MSKEPTIESVTKERDELKTSLEATEKERDGLKGDAEAATRAKGLAEKDLAKATQERDALLGKLADANTALGDAQSEIERLNGQIDELEPVPTTTSDDWIDLPDLTTPEEGGVRSFGRDAGSDRFVHVERVAFTQDVGFAKHQVLRRAEAAVRRALDVKGLGGSEDGVELPELPDFSPDRALTVVVEIA